MASATKIVVTPSEAGVFHVKNGITQEAAATASDLLNANHEQFHCFFNQSGFHNHIAHQMLTLFALGASPATLKAQYDHNASYQRPHQPLDQEVLKDLRDPANYGKYLGKERYFRDYVAFFSEEIDKKGYEEVINEYVFKGDEKADDMLVRMFAGLIHPLIHLGFGIEFKQPAIVAEALAETAVHEDWVEPLFVEPEKLASEHKAESRSLVDILDDIYADKKLSGAAHWEDDNKIRDGVLARAKDEMMKYASQWTVKPEELEEKTAEMINAAIYFTGGAQHPPKQVKFDFFYMHCVTSSLFFSSFLQQPWLSAANKARILEWKGRADLFFYASRGTPKPLLDEIVNYKPKQAVPAGKDAWQFLIERIRERDDDGHASKLVRAIAHGSEVSRPYENSAKFRIKNGMWLQLGNMAVDSFEDPGVSWVRSAGFKEAWAGIENRSQA